MTTSHSLAAALTAGLLMAGSLTTEATLTVTDFSNGGSGNLYTASGSGSQVILDNNYSGVAYSMNFGASGLNISDISVALSFSGGYNGDLYAYLSHGSTLVQLLTPNSDVTGAGISITFHESGYAVFPSSGTPSGDYTLSGLSGFNTADPNGTWVLFFADQSPGDTSTLTSFSIGITAVPEPVNVALGTFGGLFAVAGLVNLVRRWKAA